MTYVDGAFFGLFGSALYQLAYVHRYRAYRKKWPWHDKKSHTTLPFFIFGVLVKLIAAASLNGMLVYTGQISGPWAAFIAGMVAEHFILKLGDSALKELTK